MLNSQNLINKICAKINCGELTELETCQTTGALNILLNIPVVSVVTKNNLPNPIKYDGRMIYVEDEKKYYHAVDGSWLNNFNSEIFKYGGEKTWAWGCNNCGQLGDNTTTSRSSPVSVVGGFTDWCQVSAGGCHNLGVRKDGTAWAWGCNNCGRLGDGTTINRSSPVSVVGGFTDWCQVSAGCVHSLGVRCNGTAWAWGCNGNGRLGDNTLTNRVSPVLVTGGFTNWCQVSAGISHSLGVRTDGTAWAWGYGRCGQLGNNNASFQCSPVLVTGGFTDWCQVSAGIEYSLGVRRNGTAWAWGNNYAGFLGDNTTTSRSSPVSVVGGFTDWCQVSAPGVHSGGGHSLGVRRNGTAWAWGPNGGGRLGDNTTTNRSSPVSVVGGFTDWCQVSAGGSHSLGVRTNGTLWAWGFNTSGKLGDNTTTSRSSPVSVVGELNDWWSQVSAGYSHNIAIRQNRKGF
jgi:alpha-tubulin suppressor-like RCC1 family protein